MPRFLSSQHTIMLCGGMALALSFFFRGDSVKPPLPATFLLVIISVAHFSGRFASLFVAVVGGLAFAAFFFEPYGTLAVCNERHAKTCESIEGVMGATRFSRSRHVTRLESLSRGNE